MDEIGIGMVAAEIRQRRAVHHRALGKPEHAFENGMAIGPVMAPMASNFMREAGFDQCTDGIEVEQRLHQLGIVGDRIDDLDRHVADLAGADPAQVDVRRIGDPVGW